MKCGFWTVLVWRVINGRPVDQFGSTAGAVSMRLDMSIDSKYSTADFLQLLVARHYEKEHGAAYINVGNLDRKSVV